MRADRAQRLREEMAGVVMPPAVLEVVSGDPDEVSAFVTKLAMLAATCRVDGRPISSTEMAVIAYEYGWTTKQTKMAREVMKANGVYKGVG